MDVPEKGNASHRPKVKTSTNSSGNNKFGSLFLNKNLTDKEKAPNSKIILYPDLIEKYNTGVNLNSTQKNPSDNSKQNCETSFDGILEEDEDRFRTESTVNKCFVSGIESQTFSIKFDEKEMMKSRMLLRVDTRGPYRSDVSHSDNISYIPERSTEELTYDASTSGSYGNKDVCKLNKPYFDFKMPVKKEDTHSSEIDNEFKKTAHFSPIISTQDPIKKDSSLFSKKSSTEKNSSTLLVKVDVQRSPHINTARIRSASNKKDETSATNTPVTKRKDNSDMPFKPSVSKPASAPQNSGKESQKQKTVKFEEKPIGKINKNSELLTHRSYTPKPEGTPRDPKFLLPRIQSSRNTLKPIGFNKDSLNNLDKLISDSEMYDKDPEVRNKIDDLLKNIEDIHIILKQKKNTKENVSSAPQSSKQVNEVKYSSLFTKANNKPLISNRQSGSKTQLKDPCKEPVRVTKATSAKK